MAESDEQKEALRLLNIDGITGHGIHRRTGVDRKSITNYRCGRPISKRMALKLIAGFHTLSEELRPKVNMNETDQEP